MNNNTVSNLKFSPISKKFQRLQETKEDCPCSKEECCEINRLAVSTTRVRGWKTQFDQHED
ncbi:hypothetical protein K0M31_009325 [Melipona bicolor]|uniref:Uncharacterized protein n=1 Tax=Melipona bicolor TaxID=60889 RepID=A0AA40FQB2_9HYME|nr:hypothetical protein K0M31_009325 [Melipona bicolor]